MGQRQNVLLRTGVQGLSGQWHNPVQTAQGERLSHLLSQEVHKEARHKPGAAGGRPVRLAVALAISDFSRETAVFMSDFSRKAATQQTQQHDQQSITPHP